MALDAQRERLEREMTQAPVGDAFVLHPAAPQRFRAMVERLNEELVGVLTPERAAALDAFRDLIRKAVVTPTEMRGVSEITVQTEMAALLAQSGHILTVGAGTRTPRSETTLPTMTLEA